ncbi:MAG: hypothetical protein FWD57_08360 [Polyangiaceae bacterium]|nr:hypothetical protein [Polyangiaceae bacterium]
MIDLGEAVLANPSAVGTLHLTFVIARGNRANKPPDAILVNATTVRGSCDRSCILTPTDSDAHPWIKHESYIYYKMMTQLSESVLKSKKRQKPASPELLERILQGAITSRYTPPKYLPFAKTALAQTVALREVRELLGRSEGVVDTVRDPVDGANGGLGFEAVDHAAGFDESEGEKCSPILDPVVVDDEDVVICEAYAEYL